MATLFGLFRRLYMRRLRWLGGAMLCGILAGFAGDGAAQEKADSGAKIPWIPRGFRMYLVVDGRFRNTIVATQLIDEKRPLPKDDRIRIGKLHDPVTEYGLGPTIGVFVRGVPKDGTDAAVNVMKKQQELAAKFRDQRLGIWVAFLALKKDFAADDDRDKRMAEIHAVAKGAEVPLLSVGMAEATVPNSDGMPVPPKQVADWGIRADDEITIVVYHRFRLVKRWAFKKDALPGDAALKDLADTVTAMMSKKRVVD